MTDLTKITTPLALLDDKTREALIAHGGPYEYWGAGSCKWEIVLYYPCWAPGNIYRVAPPTKDTINWDHVSDEFICMARDADGETCVYTDVCYTDVSTENGGFWDVPLGQEMRDVKAVASYKQGTCDWKDSLVFRPGHEPKGEQNDE